MAKAILRTRLGRHIEDYDFWSTVVLFLVNNAMMDPGAVGPIVDYIHHMKFAPTRVVREEGGAVDVEDRVVTQARGRYNARPNTPVRNASLKRDDAAGYLRMLNRSATILQQWSEREHLRRED